MRRDSTKNRLLIAGAECFAEGGFEGVSLREITATAGENVASVNYHFGGRSQLVAAVVKFYLEPLMALRELRLRELVKSRRQEGVDLRKILELWIEPLASVNQVEGIKVNTLYELNLRWLDHSRKTGGELNKRRATLIKKCAELLEEAMPGVAEGTRRWRLLWSVETLERSLDSRNGFKQLLGRTHAKVSLEDLVDKMLDFCVAGLRCEGSATALPVSKASGAQAKSAAAKTKAVAKDAVQEAGRKNKPDGRKIAARKSAKANRPATQPAAKSPQRKAAVKKSVTQKKVAKKRISTNRK